jgi:DNA polymerase-3 subunit beta
MADIKIKIDRELFHSKISKMVRFVPKNTVIPAFDNFKLTVSNGIMEIIAGDPNIACKMHCPVSKSADFSICVAAKLLVGTIGLFSENEVILTLKSDTKIELKSGKSKYNISMDCFAADYPTMTIGTITSEIAMNQFYLKACLKSSQKFTDDTKNANTNKAGINISEVNRKIVFSATTGLTIGRAAVKPISISKWDSIILPTETAAKVMSLLDDKGEINLINSGDKIRFFTAADSADFFEVTSVATNMKFVNTEELFANMPTNCYTINTVELMNAMKRLKLYAPSEGKPSVKFSVESDGEITLFSKDINYNKDGSESVSFTGTADKHIDKSFNIDNILDILTVVESNEVNFFFNDSKSHPSFFVPKVESEEENIYSFLLTNMLDA